MFYYPRLSELKHNEISVSPQQDERGKSIVSITIPGFKYGLYNDNDFDNSIINYSSSLDQKIEITFGQDIAENSDYGVYFFQGGRYIPIGMENSESNLNNYFYSIDNNKISIGSINQTLPPELVILYLPDNLTFVDGSKYESTKELVLSPNKLTTQMKTTWINEVDRSEKSLIMPKYKGEDKVFYINDNNIPFLKDIKGTEEWFELMRGESGIILSDEGTEYYKIRIHILNEDATSMMEDHDSSMEKNPFINEYEGFVSKDFIEFVPEPLNDTTFYAIHRTNSLSEEHEYEAHLIIAPKLVGRNEILISQDLEPIPTDHYHSLESVSLWRIINNVTGSNYWSYYVDKEGRPISKFDPRSHEPEYYWDKDQMESFNIHWNEYKNYMYTEIEDFNVSKEYEEFKTMLFPTLFDNAVKLQDSWIQWGYQAGINNEETLDSVWFYHKILDLFNLADSEQYNDLFLNSTFSKNIDEDFDIKIAEFLENQVRGQELGNIIDKTFNLFYK